MKKLLALVLMIILALSCFVSCSKDEVKDVRVIEVWSNAGATQDAMAEIVKEFNENQGKERGIEIKYSVYLNDYPTIIESAMQNDQAAEILMIPGDQRKINYAKKGDVIAINDMPGGEEFLKAYGEDSLDGKEKIDGKVYYVNIAQTVKGLVYNKDLFKKAGIVDENGEALPPKTTGELVEYAKKLTDKSANIYGLGLPLKNQGWIMLSYPQMATFGELSPNGEIEKIDWDSETYEFTEHWLEYIDFVKAIKNSDATFPGAEGLDNDTMRAQFAAGRIGMFIADSWDVGVLNDQFKATCDWGVAPVPVYDGYERFENPSSRTSGYMFSKKAAECKEDAMFVYEYLMGEEVCLKLYEGGYYIPIRKGVAEKADESKFDKNWAAFGNLVAGQNIVRKLIPSLAPEGDTKEIKEQLVWQDPSVDASAFIPELNKTYTEALRKGIKDGSIDKTWFR